MSQQRRALGQAGEQAAEIFLRQKGYKILGRNVRTRRGEIDLIASIGETLVFVEVRTRSSGRHGTAAESVTWRKQQKLRELAMDYLQSSAGFVPAFRFDVIAIQGQGMSGIDMEASIEHIEHAF
ncbi:YraN family protein [Brevibacillus centrosporus]|uniref:YraN family protein n=1 Tax=Brevibacillus centrosporus TaxID=54910 RepID=UPI002E214C88|nr:YraN family protein [Brevibacillus centrosporus]MED1949127.1 YraN family protein [Brevibacillus centrosporus]